MNETLRWFYWLGMAAAVFLFAIAAGINIGRDINPNTIHQDIRNTATQLGTQDGQQCFDPKRLGHPTLQDHYDWAYRTAAVDCERETP